MTDTQDPTPTPTPDMRPRMSTTLTSAVTAGDTEISVADIDNFRGGDMFVMGNKEYTVDSTSSTSDMSQIQGQTGNVTITRPAADDISSGDAIHLTPSQAAGCNLKSGEVWINGISFTITSGIWSLTTPSLFFPSCSECSSGSKVSGELEIKCENGVKTGKLRLEYEQNGEVWTPPDVHLDPIDLDTFMGTPIVGGMRGELVISDGLQVA